jgi:hypothetical protein
MWYLCVPGLGMVCGVTGVSLVLAGCAAGLRSGAGPGLGLVGSAGAALALSHAAV